MRIPSGVTDQFIYFVAVDSTDLKTRETGLTTFTVYRSRNGAAAVAMTTPTINETDNTNMPGVYELLLDEDMTIGSGNQSEEMVFHITQASMAPVTRTIELYRSTITPGETLTVSSSILPWPAAWDAEVQSECTDALNAYDPPTRTEATSDKDEIITDLDDIKGTGFVKDTHSLIDIETFVDLIDDGTSGLAKIATDVAAVLIDTGTTLQGELDAIQAAVITNATGVDIAADIIAMKAETVLIVADTSELQGDWVNTGRLDTILDSILTDTGTTLDTKINDIQGATFSSATDSLEAIRDRGDTEWVTGGGTGLTALDSGTLRAGGTSTQALLPSARTFADDILNGNTINLLAGTGAGQSRVIVDYALTGDIATIFPAWATNPDATTTYEIVQGSANIAAISLATQTAGDIVDLITTVDTVVDGIQTDLSNGTDGLGAIKAETALIVADTNELQTDDVPTLIAAVQSDTDDIQTRLPAALVGGLMSSDVTAISTDAVAADNLELMFDGTGYTDDTGPASRAQVDGIGASSGGALNFANEADNIDSAIKGITFDGVETSGTNASVNSEDGVYHVIDDTANNIDIVYQFDVGGGRTGVEVTWKGYLNGVNDEATVQAYNGTSFDTLFTISGKGGATNDTHVIPLLSTHTGIGADIGKVFIRIECVTQSNPTLNTDSLLMSAVNIGQSVGYALGAVWIDTVNGVAGTEDFVNGTADNPVASIADTNTLLASRNLARVVVSPSSSFTLAASQENQLFAGDGWTLALGGQSISGSHFSGADITGTGIGATEFHFEHCEMGACTIAGAHLDECDLSGTIILSAADTYFFINCSHAGGTATIDFGAAVGNTTVHVHNYHGALTIANMGQTGTDVLHFSSPDGKLTLAASCIGGTVHMNGTFDFVNSGSGMTINDDGAILETIGAPVGADVSADIAAVKAETALIVADTNELQGDWVNGGRLDLLLDAIPITAMRGTDSAALASVCTEARLAKNDSLTFTKANELDANTKSINDAEVVGDGNATPWDGV